jgi:hypothetical protein
MADPIIEFGEDDEIRKPEFQVQEMSSASWCVRMIRDARLEMANNADVAQAEYARLERERAKVDAWLAKTNASAQQTIDYMESKLEPWIKITIEGRKKRSVDLPFGRAGFKVTPGRMEYKDEKSVVAWAKENAPDIVVVKESVPKPQLKAAIELTGEVPEGVEFIFGEDKFYVETKEE